MTLVSSGSPARPLGSSWNPLGLYFGLSGHIEAILRHLGAVWSLPAQSSCHLGPYLGRQGALLGAVLGISRAA